ncbi:MAG: SGNH hydrolase domain-containing protein [Chloroflexota bacterium]
MVKGPGRGRRLTGRLLAAMAMALVAWPAGSAVTAAASTWEYVDSPGTDALAASVALAMESAARSSVVPSTAAVTVAAVTTSTSRDDDGDGLTNAFELKYGLDPHDKDTDGDGLLDPIEDPDKDELSNLGEQRYGLDPHKADTDKDGIKDGLEDSNGNGTDNRHEQDRRPIPAKLRPTLSGAFDDKPAPYIDDCHNGGVEVTLHPCVYGDPHGSRTIVLFGDSHAVQWQPALAKAGARAGWRIVLLSKSSCPAADLTWERSSVFKSCAPWREKAKAWITKHPPSLVILASARLYQMYDVNRQPMSESAQRDAWGQALKRTIDAMPSSSRVIVLADTPRPDVDVPSCLRTHPKRINACVTPQHIGTDTPWVQEEKSVASAAGAAYVGFNRLVCPYDPCPVVNGNVLMWRDDSHLTATFSKMLAPSVRDAVRKVMR